MISGAVAALLAAPAMGARVVAQKGVVDGDPEAVVKLAVAKKEGAPSSVRGIRFKDLLAECDTGEEQIALELTGPAPVAADGSFERAYGEEKTGLVRVKGTVSRDGKSVDGELRGTTIESGSAGTCEIPSVSFSTSR